MNSAQIDSAISAVITLGFEGTVLDLLERERIISAGLDVHKDSVVARTRRAPSRICCSARTLRGECRYFGQCGANCLVGDVRSEGDTLHRNDLDVI